jgi:hypothetical protein
LGSFWVIPSSLFVLQFVKHIFVFVLIWGVAEAAMPWVVPVIFYLFIEKEGTGSYYYTPIDIDATT